MKKLLQIINENEANAAFKLIQKNIKNTSWDHKIFAAGGYVRDEILKTPSKDLDIIVNDTDGGIKFATWLAKKLKIYKPNSNPVIFKTFGTAKLTLKNIKFLGYDLSNFDIEFVMPRGEKYTKGSRKPEVYKTTLKQDALRRDLTVNSLFKNLSNNEILDLTGKGIDDLKNGIARTPLDNPDETFSDDPLRMLRLIRFSVKYNWKLPRFMLMALKKNAKKITYISEERIQDELNKILLTNYPDKGIRLLQWTGLSKYIMPELDNLVGLTQNKYHKDDAFKHTLQVLKNVPPNLINRLGALFHDIGKFKTKTVTNDTIQFLKHEKVGAEIAENILRRLKYPLEIINAVKKSVENHMRLKAGGDDGNQITDKVLRRLKRDIGPFLEHLLDIMHADNISHSDEHSMPNQIPNIRKRLDKMIDDIGKSQHIKLPINGNDILKLGVKPGPKIKEMLGYVEDAYLENPNLSREEALQILKNNI